MRLAFAALAFCVVTAWAWRMFCGPKELASERALRLVNQSLDEQWALAVPRIVGQQTQYGRRITKG